MGNETGSILLTLGAAVAISSAAEIQGDRKGTPMKNVLAGSAIAAILITVGSVAGPDGGEIAEAVAFAILVGVIYRTYSLGTGPSLTSFLSSSSSINISNPNPASHTTQA